MGHVRSKLGGLGHHPWGEFFFWLPGFFLEKLPFLPVFENYENLLPYS